MTSPSLIVITGPVASGKTTLSQRLAKDLPLPLFNRDQFQELLYDSLGWSDSAWARTLGRASYGVFYYALETTLQTGHSLIIESNFQPRYATPKLLELTQCYSYRPFQLCCKTAPELRLERFCQRIREGRRHPGHAESVEEETLAHFQESNTPEPLELGGELLFVDTSSEQTLQYEALLQQIQQHQVK